MKYCAVYWNSADTGDDNEDERHGWASSTDRALPYVITHAHVHGQQITARSLAVWWRFRPTSLWVINADERADYWFLRWKKTNWRSEVCRHWMGLSWHRPTPVCLQSLTWILTNEKKNFFLKSKNRMRLKIYCRHFIIRLCFILYYYCLLKLDYWDM